METSMEIKNYYSILSISRNATQDELKKAFKNKAKKYHPDVCKAPDAHQKFIDISEAYEVLKDSYTRRNYDALLDQLTKNTKNTYSNSDTYESDQDRAYHDFRNTQQKAKTQAEKYARMSFDDLVSNVLDFAFEIGRTVLVGERYKPNVTLWDYIKLGFYGILLTICIIISFTGVGAIPGIVIAKGVYEGMKKNGKFIGIGPLLISTLIADTIVVIILSNMLYSAFH